MGKDLTRRSFLAISSSAGVALAIKSTATLNVTGKTRVVRGEDRAFFSAATVGWAAFDLAA